MSYAAYKVIGSLVCLWHSVIDGNSVIGGDSSRHCYGVYCSCPVAPATTSSTEKRIGSVSLASQSLA